MRRFVSISWISLFVIVAAVGVMAFAPATRLLLSAAIKDSSEPWLHPPDLKERVRKHPRDAQAWLALAVSAGKPTGAGPVDMKALRRAMELKAGWAAPYLVAGSAAISTFKLPMLWRLEVAMARPPGGAQRAAPLHRETKPLTSAEREGVRRAREMLQKARALQPDNAAPDYLLAYLALEERRDQDALALLHSALRKSRWSLGERDTGIALYETAARLIPPLQAHLFAMTTTSMREFETHKRLRDLARGGAEMSTLAQQRGDHEQAIFLRESAMHLGRVLMADAYTTIEVLVGKAIWQIATSERLTPVERTAATRGIPRTDWQRYNRAVTQAKHAKLMPYLRAQGRADLADRIARFDRSYPSWDAALLKAIRAWNSPGSFVWALERLAVILAAQGAALALLVSSGLAYLILAVARRRPVPIAWARWKWALVVVLSLGLPGAVALGMSHKWTAPFAVAQSGSVPWGLISVAFGLLLLLIATPVVTWRVRRRVEVSARAGFFRQFIGTLTAVVLPVAAIIMLALTPSAVRMGAQVQRGEEVMIYQGELAYYGLQPPLAAQGNRHSRVESYVGGARGDR